MAALAVAAALATTGAALAASSCGKRVIDDWYDDGRVDGTYPVHCYDDAIDALPRDVRDYSSAKEDIQRALANRLRGQEAPPARTDPSPERGTGSSSETGDETETTAGPGSRPGDDGPDLENSASGVDTTASDSVPLPLLVLAGLALLLVAAGSAGYLVRRLQARRHAPPSP